MISPYQLLLFGKKELKKAMAQKIEFIIDKVDGEIFLGQHDRTVKNELATNKAKAIGELTTRIVAAIESLQNNDSLYITIRKED